MLLSQQSSLQSLVVFRQGRLVVQRSLEIQLRERYKLAMECSVMIYYIHIKFFSDSRTVFCWQLIMKLRHKKPLNSYKGQTNNDKNEFDDDDFRQQGSPGKKVKQLSKYAKILSRFIKTINQDYRLSSLHNEDFSLALTPDRSVSRPKVEITQELQTVLPKKQQVKQQKQITKLQNKIELKSQKKQMTPIPRKPEPSSLPPPIKQLKNTNPKPPKNQQLDQKTPPPPPKNQQQNKNIKLTTQKTQQPKSTIEPPVNKPPKSIPNPNPSPSINPIPSPNSNMPMGYPNMMNFGNLPPNLQAIMNTNPLLANLNFMRMNGMNGMGAINPMQLGQMLMRSYNSNMLYGGIPPTINLGNLGMTGMGLPNMQNNPQYLIAPNSPPQKPFQSLFQVQVKSFKSIGQTAQKDIKTVYPLKHAAFHIAISYKIYLDKMKRRGKNLQNLEEIDPTKNGRRARSHHQQSKNSKQADKKKK